MHLLVKRHHCISFKEYLNPYHCTINEKKKFSLGTKLQEYGILINVQLMKKRSFLWVPSYRSTESISLYNKKKVHSAYLVTGVWKLIVQLTKKEVPSGYLVTGVLNPNSAINKKKIVQNCFWKTHFNIPLNKETKPDQTKATRRTKFYYNPQGIHLVMFLSLNVKQLENMTWLLNE